MVTPFGNDEEYLPTLFGESGTIEMVIRDVNLQANSNAGPLEVVSDNSNQGNKSNYMRPWEPICKLYLFY